MLNKMIEKDNNFTINKKKSFIPISKFKSKTLNLCFEFAWNMTFGENGEHRSYRSGGQYNRKNGEIFINAFQGKLAELAVYNIFWKNNIILSNPDFETYNLGKWDDSDFTYKNKNFSIKSTSFIGNLLLLEVKDWDFTGRYIPNNKIYDYHILVRIRPDGKKIMKKNNIMYSNKIDKKKLYEIIIESNWEFEITGYMNNGDLRKIINNGLIIPQNATLNRFTKMDAKNYYIQAGDLKNINNLIKEIKLL